MSQCKKEGDETDGGERPFAWRARLLGVPGGGSETLPRAHAETDEEAIRGDNGDEGGQAIGPESHGGETVCVVSEAEWERAKAEQGDDLPPFATDRGIDEAEFS